MEEVRRADVRGLTLDCEEGGGDREMKSRASFHIGNSVRKPSCCLVMWLLAEVLDVTASH